MKLYFGVLMVITSICFSCSDINDYYLDIDKTPSIVLENNKDTLFDTLKINMTKIYKFKIEDEETLIPVTSIAENYSTKISANDVTVKALKNGNVILNLTVKDSFDKTAHAYLTLNIFDNLPPVASLNYTYNVDAEGQLFLKLDASGSYDKDAKFGGSIATYEFYINGILVDSDTKPYFLQVISTGTYNFRLRVQDNEGVWSNYAEILNASINGR